MIAVIRPAFVGRLVFAVEALVVVTIIANIAVTFGNALVRYLTNQDFSWASDVWAILISIITFLGAPAYFRRGAGSAEGADKPAGHIGLEARATGLAPVAQARDARSMERGGSTAYWVLHTKGNIDERHERRS